MKRFLISFHFFTDCFFSCTLFLILIFFHIFYLFSFWPILKYLVTIFMFFVDFFGMLLLSVRTLFYFLQCLYRLPFTVYIFTLVSFKLLGTSGQDSYPIFVTLEILIWLFLQRSEHLSEVYFPFCPYSFYLGFLYSAHSCQLT